MDLVSGGNLRSIFGVALTVLATATGAGAATSNDRITMNKDYSSQRYVDLDQINTANVGSLKEVCEAQLNEPSWYNSGLLMVDRTIYTATLRATYAIDAATCAIRWRSEIQLGKTANISTRGPAYLDGAIFRGTADGRVIALDAKTGSVLWDQKLAEPEHERVFCRRPHRLARQGLHRHSDQRPFDPRAADRHRRENRQGALALQYRAGHRRKRGELGQG